MTSDVRVRSPRTAMGGSRGKTHLMDPLNAYGDGGTGGS